MKIYAMVWGTPGASGWEWRLTPESITKECKERCENGAKVYDFILRYTGKVENIDKYVDKWMDSRQSNPMWEMVCREAPMV